MRAFGLTAAMQKKSFTCGGRQVWLYGGERPELLFLQPVDAHDAALLDREWDAMQDAETRFALAAFAVEDWNRDLSPWEAPPVFGKIPFGGEAEKTLGFICGGLLPALRLEMAWDESVKLCIGGYSLAGLFALWAATRTERFSAVAAASPSVWFPGWLSHVKEHPIRAKTVYLSLGDREERTKNPVMATVGDCIREQYAMLQPGYTARLEWNPGNHFQDPELRTARAFRFVAEQEKGSGVQPSPCREEKDARS